MNEKINVLFSEEQIQSKVKMVADNINKIYGNNEVYVICVLKGAVMFAVDLVRNLTMPVKMEFIRLSSYNGGTKSSGRVNAVDISLPDLNDKNVLIIEDIVDTGLTAKFLMDFIKTNFHTKSTKFCSLLDKKIARLNDIKPDFYCFEVDDKFLVGYGLDKDGCYRNLKYIGFID